MLVVNERRKTARRRKRENFWKRIDERRMAANESVYRKNGTTPRKILGDPFVRDVVVRGVLHESLSRRGNTRWPREIYSSVLSWVACCIQPDRGTARTTYVSRRKVSRKTRDGQVSGELSGKNGEEYTSPVGPAAARINWRTESKVRGKTEVEAVNLSRDEEPDWYEQMDIEEVVLPTETLIAFPPTTRHCLSQGFPAVFHRLPFVPCRKRSNKARFLNNQWTARVTRKRTFKAGNIIHSRWCAETSQSRWRFKISQTAKEAPERRISIGKRSNGWRKERLGTGKGARLPTKQNNTANVTGASNESPSLVFATNEQQNGRIKV